MEELGLFDMGRAQPECQQGIALIGTVHEGHASAHAVQESLIGGQITLSHVAVQVEPADLSQIPPVTSY